MAWPITFHMRDCPLTAAMQAGIIACADARIRGVEVVECCRERRQVVVAALATFALQQNLGLLG